MSGARALVLCLPLLASGCFAYVRPGDPSSIPATASLATSGGQRLEIDDTGALVLGYAQGDVEAALGVTLVVGASGVTVAAVRSSTDGAVVALEVGDVLLEALPYAPWLPAEMVPLEAAWIPVRDVEDLRGLAVGLTDLELGLRVKRGEQEVVVRQPLRAPTVVATRPWSPELATQLGADLCALHDWPASRLPVEARPEDYLVVRVQAGSAAALAGLGEFERAERLMTSAVRKLKKDARVPAVRTLPVLRRAVEMYSRWGKAEQAAEFEQQLAEARRESEQSPAKAP